MKLKFDIEGGRFIVTTEEFDEKLRTRGLITEFAKALILSCNCPEIRLSSQEVYINGQDRSLDRPVISQSVGGYDARAIKRKLELAMNLYGAFKDAQTPQ
jgi:hypothetical protein